MPVTKTVSAAGYVVAPWLTVTGLSEEELPRSAAEDGVYLREVEGLGIGESVNPGKKSVGYIALLRKNAREQGTDEASPVVRYTDLDLTMMSQITLPHCA